jgi:hypothetical protein
MPPAMTELGRWRLDSIQGAHRWRYLDPEDSGARPQSKAEQYFLGTLKVRVPFIWPERYADEP